MVAGCGLLGGCAHDCQERYCDVVRAGASGWFAHELQCCRRPDSPGCDDRETRLQVFSVLATQMRAACEDANWNRFRELWNEALPLLPAGLLLVVADDFCDGWDWAGRNVTTPFAAADVVTASLALDPAPPRLQLARPSGGDGGIAVAESVRPLVEHAWTVRSGSMVSVHAFGETMGFAATGELTVVETFEPGEIAPGDDLESWCRRMKPVAFSLDLDGVGGGVALRLDPGFEGSQVRFDEPRRGVIGVAVTVDAAMSWPGDGPLELSIDSAYLEIPFELAADGSLAFAPDGAVSMLDLWPVDPAVEAWIRGEDPIEAAGDEDIACVERAQAVAAGFLALHPACTGTGD